MCFESRVRGSLKEDFIKNCTVLQEEIGKLAQTGVETVETSTWGSIDTEVLQAIIYFFKENLEVTGKTDG